jgi:60 kDa SS-A/Ro ribonucleoprotein
MTYLSKWFNRKQTPQSAPIPGTAQVRNSAGGFAFPVDDWTRLDRFLVLGSEGGTYYASEQKLTRENAQVVDRCLGSDGVRLVQRVVVLSQAGRAPKNEPALFALAMAAKLGAEPARQAAFAALPQVARTGTHLFHFAEYVKALGGWGRGTMRAFAQWYTTMEPARLALQAVKYQSRDGWSHRDLLRKAHPKAKDAHQQALFHWMTAGWPSVGETPHPDRVLALVWAFERAKRLRDRQDVPTLLGLLADYQLPHECIPTEMKQFPEVWEALLPTMGLSALLRNLGKMTEVGLLGPSSAAERMVVERLGSSKNLRAARVHPLQVLVALRTYAQGHGVRGHLAWQPRPRVLDALDAAFYASFRAVEATGARTLLALDVSGSMDNGTIAGMPGITPRVGSAAMAMVTAAVEPRHELVAFTAGTVPTMHPGYGCGLSALAISPRMRLDDVVRTVSALPFGGTDCALPMVWAAKNRVPVDVFCVYTDSETWAGNIHPVQALDQYRQKMGIAARLIVIGMVSNGFSIADPNDDGMLDVVGFDAATPSIIAGFVRG